MASMLLLCSVAIILPPSPVLKPLAGGLVDASTKWPALLPLAHAAMDALQDEQARGVLTLRASLGYLAALIGPRLARPQVASIAPTSPTTRSDLPLDHAPHKWHAPITRSFERVTQALVALVAARLELAMIDLRLALLDTRTKLLEAFAKKVEGLKADPQPSTK